MIFKNKSYRLLYCLCDFLVSITQLLFRLLANPGNEQKLFDVQGRTIILPKSRKSCEVEGYAQQDESARAGDSPYRRIRR